MFCICFLVLLFASIFRHTSLAGGHQGAKYAESLREDIEKVLGQCNKIEAGMEVLITNRGQSPDPEGLQKLMGLVTTTNVAFEDIKMWGQRFGISGTKSKRQKAKAI